MSYLFTGFSTLNSQGADPQVLHDLDIITENLNVRFNVFPGEQVMRPERGCTIWYMLEEQYTDTLAQAIITEATRICEMDPRLSVLGVNPIQYDQGIRVEITLQYIPFNSVGTFIMDFNNRQSSLMNASGNS